ncbi:MAG: GDSL-type esterase/lipase family protein [Bacteroides sp.]|nr:GDSL-type esterase/lipase family protein [Bacteroides sp.]MCM1447478.1 GDSL-type esterase/lipase family protein [Bacteroides sp.]
MNKITRIFLLLCVLAMYGIAGFAQKKVRVACVGNSITYGYLLPDRETNAYPFRLQKMLGDGYEVGNFGKSGATLLNHGHRPYTQQQEYRDALEFAGDIVVIHLGINDTDPRNWPNYQDEFIGDYRALIQSFRKANPAARIIIARMTPLSHRHPRFESGTRDWHDQIQEAISHVARAEGVQLINFYEPLLPYPYLLHDAIHPDTEGAEMLASIVYRGITGDYGGLKMSPLYTDNMVLQHGRELQIQGMADAGQRVTLSIAGQKRKAIADGDGHWHVTLRPLKAGGPYTMTVATDKRELTYRNVMAGEVWLCSGQSNMEFRLSQAATAGRDIPKAGCSDIRLFDMKARWRTDAVEWAETTLDSLNHLQYFRETAWQECTPATAQHFSAVAYYFGRMLQDSLHVPVGLICNAVGGSPAESWIPRRTLEHDFPAILRNWTANDFIQPWVRERAAQNVRKSSNKFQRHPYEPCYLFESGILPLQHFPIRGVIWYQGESNAHNIEAHERLFTLLVQGWRQYWNDDTLPFYYVQLSSLNRPSWPLFRDSQRRLLSSIQATGMAVSSDVGNPSDVHPTHKEEVGKRLARLALHGTYGMEHVVPSGPLFRTADFRNGSAYVRFDHAEGLRPASTGDSLLTFELAGEDHIFYPAQAEIQGQTVKVHSTRVPLPCIVRYGWQPYTRANLVNGEGLPASTFRSDY